MTAEPALALTWQLWARNRWTAPLLALSVGALALAAHAPGALASRHWVFTAAIPLALALLFLLAAFAFPEGDVLSARSGFPAWMLTLPAPTGALVFWPMLHGWLAAALAWVLPVQLILRPLGVPAPVWWPAAMLAALLACLQALLWTPMRVPYLRVGAALVGLPVLVIAGINAALEGVPPALLCGAYLGLIPLAYGAAVLGLGRARRGETAEWQWRAPALGAGPSAERALRSAGQAQLWFEWRSSGAALPMAVAAVCVLLSLPLLWVRELAPLEMNPPRSAFGGIEANLWVWMQQGALFLPPLLAAILGCGRRRYDTARRDLSLHPFLATRPLPAGAFVAAKLKAAALSTLVAWAVMLLFYATWLLLPARDGDRTAPLALLLARHCPPATALTLLLLLAILVLWTWKNQVQGLWADLSGRPWVIYGMPFVAHSLALAGLVLYAHWAAEPRGMDLRYAAVPPAIPWLFGGAVLLKLLASGWSLRALRRLLRMRVLVAGIGVWLVLACALTLALRWIAVDGGPSSHLAGFVAMTYLPVCAGGVPREFHSPGYLAAVAVLFLPFTRLALAPLALDWNRHR